MNEKAPPVIMNWSSASGHFACRIEAPLDPRDGDIMRIHVGCELSFGFPKRSYVAAASIFKVVAFGPAVAWDAEMSCGGGATPEQSSAARI